LHLGIRYLRHAGGPAGLGRAAGGAGRRTGGPVRRIVAEQTVGVRLPTGPDAALRGFRRLHRQALRYTQQVLRCELPESDQDRLLEAYLYLPPFPEVAASLDALKTQGHQLVAFSNGVEASIRALLANAGVLPRLEDVVSVDDLRTFKPDPEVYAYLARRTGRALGETWLISSNAWDVIGVRRRRGPGSATPRTAA
jgi:2-haloalkanoic acid dehalogenase type II